MENRQNAIKVKSKLKNLTKQTNGIVELKVYINEFESGNRNIAPGSLFENEKALRSYQVYPEYRRVSEFVGAVLCDMACIDYA